MDTIKGLGHNGVFPWEELNINGVFLEAFFNFGQQGVGNPCTVGYMGLITA